MKIIITGCGGILGRELIHQLVKEKYHTIYALTSQVEKISMLIGTNPCISVLHSDALIKGQIVCDTDTILINCAFPRDDDDYNMAQGLQYIRTVLSKAAQEGVGGIINISSQSIYDCNRTYSATEDDPPVLQSKYAVGKYATELFTQLLQPFVPCTNVRLASLISKDFDQRLTNKMVDIALKNKELSVLKCDQRFGFLDVEDAARAIIRLMNTPTETWASVYNLGSNFSYSLIEIAQTISHLLSEEWNYHIIIKELYSDKKGSSALCSERLQSLIGEYQQITLEESLRRIIEKKQIQGLNERHMAKPINVTRSSMPDYFEYCEEIKDFWNSRWLTNMGVKHRQLEAQLKDYLDVPHVTLYTNGHLALENVITAMNFPVGGEVITTPFTFASTTHAIARNGLVPIFCDINDVDYTIDVTKIEALITEKTVAILPVHVYGNLCDIDSIQSIADRHDLKVIYDAAHAFGVEKDGVNASNFGDASMFSFHATKVFNTIEGGAVTYQEKRLAEILNDMKNFGIRGPESVVYVGGNAKMNEFQAAMGICNLRHVDNEIRKRKSIVEYYRKRLIGIHGIRLCNEQEGVKHNYAYFPVVFDGYKYSRDEVYELLRSESILARKYFFPLTNSFECYQNLPTSGVEKTPVAKFIADRVLTLPLYADLELYDVDRICDLILK